MTLGLEGQVRPETPCIWGGSRAGVQRTPREEEIVGPSLWPRDLSPYPEVRG